MKTKTLALIAVVLLFVLGAILYFSSARTRLSNPVTKESEVEEKVVKGTIYLQAKLAKDETGKSIIQITATPDSESPLLLSALSIKGIVVSDSNDLSTLDDTFVLTPGKEIENWLFLDESAYPDSKVYPDPRGGIVILLNAAVQSEELYPLEKELVLATIPLNATPTQQELTLELDSEFTEFFGMDAKNEFMIKAK